LELGRAPTCEGRGDCDHAIGIQDERAGMADQEKSGQKIGPGRATICWTGIRAPARAQDCSRSGLALRT